MLAYSHHCYLLLGIMVISYLIRMVIWFTLILDLFWLVHLEITWDLKVHHLSLLQSLLRSVKTATYYNCQGVVRRWWVDCKVICSTISSYWCLKDFWQQGNIWRDLFRLSRSCKQVILQKWNSVVRIDSIVVHLVPEVVRVRIWNVSLPFSLFSV